MLDRLIRTHFMILLLGPVTIFVRDAEVRPPMHTLGGRKLRQQEPWSSEPELLA